jgi:hypothetical protein
VTPTIKWQHTHHTSPWKTSIDQKEEEEEGAHPFLLRRGWLKDFFGFRTSSLLSLKNARSPPLGLGLLLLLLLLLPLALLVVSLLEECLGLVLGEPPVAGCGFKCA